MRTLSRKTFFFSQVWERQNTQCCLWVCVFSCGRQACLLLENPKYAVLCVSFYFCGRQSSLLASAKTLGKAVSGMACVRARLVSGAGREGVRSIEGDICALV